jgi:hypothetical protein
MIKVVDVSHIFQIARFVSIRPLAVVNRVEITPGADQDGNEALRVLIVLNDTTAAFVYRAIDPQLRRRGRRTSGPETFG